MSLRVAGRFAVSSILIAVLACGSNEPILDPGDSPLPRPEWNALNCPDGLSGRHLRVALSPSVGKVEIGDTLRLSVSASNSGGTGRCRVYLRIQGGLQLVDSTSVVATGLGATRITALLPEDSTSATLDVVPASPIMPRRFRVVDLTAAFGSDSVVFGRMNGRREVVGNSSGRAFLRRADGIRYLDGCSQAYDVNARGEVPCFLNPGIGVWRDGSITAIPELSGVTHFSSVSLAINDSGTIAGSRGGDLFVVRDGKFASITSALPPTLFPIAARRVNNAGQIFVSTRVDEYIAVVYVVKDGQLVDRAFIGTGRFMDANDAGAIVGSVQERTGSQFALLGLVDHGSQERLGQGIAMSVDNATRVVGTLSPHASYGEDSTQVDYSLRGAFLWERSLGLTRLRWSAIDPSWVITEALQIIDDGTMIAKADNVPLGRIGRTVMLIPEP